MENLTLKEKAEAFDKLLKQEKKKAKKIKVSYKFNFKKYLLHSLLIILCFVMCLSFMFPINNYAELPIKIVAWVIYGILFVASYVGYFLLMYFKTRTAEVVKDENYIASVRLADKYKREVKLAKTRAKLNNTKTTNEDIIQIKANLFEEFTTNHAYFEK